MISFTTEQKYKEVHYLGLVLLIPFDIDYLAFNEPRNGKSVLWGYRYIPTLGDFSWWSNTHSEKLGIIEVPVHWKDSLKYANSQRIYQNGRVIY
jgi:hypothetical protein